MTEYTPTTDEIRAYVEEMLGWEHPEWGIWQDYEGWSLHPSEPLRNLAAEYRKENTDD